MLRRSNSYLLIALAMGLVGCQSVPLSEQEKAVRYAPASRTVSLALNDSCSVVALRRMMGNDVAYRQAAVALSANIVQYFPGSIVATGSTQQNSNGTTTTHSSTSYEIPLVRFWNCTSIPGSIKEKVAVEPDLRAAFDD